MSIHNKGTGKVITTVLITVVLVLVALAVGYYLGMLKYEKEFEHLSSEFDKFRAHYEYRLTSMESNLNKALAFISEKKGETEEQVNKIKLMGLLLDAKGEIISSQLSLADKQPDTSFKKIDEAIHNLQEALILSNQENAEIIEKIRLDLATVKGILESNAQKAQKELDSLWRRIDKLTVQK